MDAPRELLLLTADDLERALERSRDEPVLLFKHSTACPASAHALGELRRYLAEPRAPFAGVVRVIEERPLSREIERRLGVPHESPQAIAVRDGRPRGHLSHGAITAESLASLLAGP